MTTIGIGYFGEPGSNTENAARGYFGFFAAQGAFEVIYCSYATEEDLLDALKNQKIDKCVLPIENSVEGLVTSVADQLANGDGIIVESEIISKIHHNLIGVSDISQIKTIISHPQALSQCRKSINKIGVKIKTRAVGSTSAAVKEVAEQNNPEIAAIGSTQALEIYQRENPNLKILYSNINDVEKNRTRFLVLGRDKRSRTGNDRTSIVFGVEDKPGALYHVLAILYANDVNMDHLSSRPLKTELGEYLFWVDISGHKEDKDIRQALEKIAKKTTFLKILGSYPKAE